MENNELKNLDFIKEIPQGNIPIRHLKETSNFCSNVLTNIISYGIRNSNFPKN